MIYKLTFYPTIAILLFHDDAKDNIFPKCRWHCAAASILSTLKKFPELPLCCCFEDYLQVTRLPYYGYAAVSR